MTISGATTPGQRERGSDGNEGVLRIPQSSGITGTSPSDCLVSYYGRSLAGRSYPYAEMQSVYSTAPTDWVSVFKENVKETWQFMPQNQCTHVITNNVSNGFSPNEIEMILLVLLH